MLLVSRMSTIVKVDRHEDGVVLVLVKICLARHE